MKAIRLIAIATLVSTSIVCRAADAKAGAAAKPAAAKADDLSTYKTADALWAHLVELQKDPEVQAKTREEFLALALDWLTKQRAAADAFVKSYPDDKRRFEAKMVSLQARMQISQIPGTDPSLKPSPEAVLKEVESVIEAPDAPEAQKGEATFVKTMMMAASLEADKPETIVKFFAASDAFLAKWGAHKLADKMRETQIQIATAVEIPEAQAILKKYAEGSDERLATTAKEIIGQRAKMQELRTKPIELKFTATDGAEIDIAKLRGKVVLVDFWASWCGPCMAEAPNVVAAYKDYHAKGFEILGISLDQEKEAMESALKKNGMTWAQFFDGKGWQNSVSTSFGITSIPAAWLVDKKGMLREVNLRGEALGGGVAKLLAE